MKLNKIYKLFEDVNKHKNFKRKIKQSNSEFDPQFGGILFEWQLVNQINFVFCA